VETLATASKSDLPARIAEWLDALDETGRWALLKLITRELRVGASARLAKTAVAQLGGFEPDEVELIWHGLEAPYEDLFAWVEGRGPKPNPATRRRSARRCCRIPSEDEDVAKLDASAFLGEWKWDGIRLQAASGRGATGGR
jgi:DNA ligase-1